MKYGYKYLLIKFCSAAVIVIFAFQTNKVFAQDILRDVPTAKKFLKTLKKQKIDTILIYSSGCVGCRVTYEEPKTIDSNYVIPYYCYCPWGHVELYFIWKIRGQSYISKFDYCSTFKTIRLESNPDELFKFYAVHKTTWDSEITYWKLYESGNKKGNIKFLPPGPDHFGFDNIYFDKYEFSLPDYYFENNDWDFAKWKYPQREWITLVRDFLHENNFKWVL